MINIFWLYFSGTCDRVHLRNHAPYKRKPAMNKEKREEQKHTHVIQIVDSEREKVVKDIMCFDVRDAMRIRQLFYRVLNQKLGHRFTYIMVDLNARENEAREMLELERAKLAAETAEKAKKIQEIIELQAEVARLRDLYNEMIGSRFGRSKSKSKAVV